MNKIRLEKEFRIPGTDVVLEKGDVVHIVERGFAMTTAEHFVLQILGVIAPGFRQSVFDKAFDASGSLEVGGVTFVKNDLLKSIQTYGSPKDTSKVLFHSIVTSLERLGFAQNQSSGIPKLTYPGKALVEF